MPWPSLLTLAAALALAARGATMDLHHGLLAQTGASRTALAIVSDAKNRAIVDVGADDFVIQEGGQPREVLSVRVADYPVVIMLDTGADARVDFAMMRKAVERFIGRLGTRPIAIGTFSDAPKMLTSFDDVVSWARPRFASLDHEEVWLLGLDGRNALKAARRIAHPLTMPVGSMPVPYLTVNQPEVRHSASLHSLSTSRTSEEQSVSRIRPAFSRATCESGRCMENSRSMRSSSASTVRTVASVTDVLRTKLKTVPMTS